ncbi:MAG: hypothetical protein E7812_07855 [Phenylobacterium sp.]|nr:MAG: hypothetical protein E7812_07855 [Phenylobacterium sp.]
MPKGIGRQGIAGRPGVGERQIGHGYGPGIGGVLSFYLSQSTSPTTLTPGVRGILYLFGYGGGAGGSSGGTNGGGGGSAGFVAMRVTAATVITHSLAVLASAATDGNASVVTVDGRTFTAGGGFANGQGGQAVGFDINRTGGASGAAGPNGGSAGTTSGSQVGGGGCAGFLDQLGGAGFNAQLPMLSNGGNGNSSGTGGSSTFGSGGGAGSTSGGSGGKGTIFFMIVQDVAK